MMEIISFIESFPPEHRTILYGLLLFLWLLSNRNKIIGINKTLRDINSKYKKELRNYVRSKMDTVIFLCITSARDQMADLKYHCTGKGCIINPIETQLGCYEARTEVVVRTYLTDEIFKCLYENGFHDMTDIEREVYFNDTGKHLHQEVLKRVATYKHQFPQVLTLPEMRYTEQDAINGYKDIVIKYLRLNELEKQDIRSAEDEVNIFKRLIKFIIKLKEGPNAN